LQEQRVARIAAPHARDITARHAQREFASRRECGFEQRGVEVERGAQLGRIGDVRVVAKLAREGGCGYHLRPFGESPLFY
jgi:hypothetical protein